MGARTFDVIVIGAGPAGEVAAGRIAQRSERSVAIVERELVGGECSFYACMPSKALLRPQELRRELGRVPGVCEQPPPLDASAIARRRDEVIHDRSDESQLPWLRGRGVELLRGHAQLDGERRVRVDGELHIANEAVVIATGSDAAIPPIPGLAEAQPWTNREATTAESPPASLVVLGGGPVGCELAQAWRSLGSEVCLLEAAERLLVKEEPCAGEQVAESLRCDGVSVRLGVKARAVSGERGRSVVELDDGSVVASERLLVATGRTPRTHGLGLESVGLPADSAIEVDDQLRSTSEPWLYAVGDVNGHVLLTHMGKYQARIAADAILGGQTRIELDGLRSPRVTFTEPEVAAVGHTLASASDARLRARPVDLETSGTAGASFRGYGAPGSTRFVIDEERDVLAGATFVGFETAEMLHAATVAVVSATPLSALAHAVAPFPTRSELWLQLLEAVGR
ncbi:MAG: dihydrolipoyl dehydrogenase family protein [Solirubrobacteraceae bacterium]